MFLGSLFETETQKGARDTCFLSIVGTLNKEQLIFQKMGEISEILEFPYLPFLRSDPK